MVVDVIIALRNWNMEKLNEEVLAVSSPRSARYGQHLRPSEVADLTSAAPDAQVAVSSWLHGAGIAHRFSKWGDRIELQATLARVERLFSTSVHVFSKGVRSVLQAEDLYAPAEAARAIAAVFGLHGTPWERPRARRRLGGRTSVTPELLRVVHQVSGVQVARSGRNCRAVVEFQGQYVRQNDLSAFFARYVPDAHPGDQNYTCFPAGCEPPKDGHAPVGVEAMLDVEYIMGPAPGIKTEVWMFSGMAWCTDLKNWTAHLLDRDSPPRVFSVGYGVQGNVSLDKLQGCSREAVLNIEEDFVKIAARGVSLIFSAGDDGSGGTFLLKSKLFPVWPGSAPHATGVGATQFTRGVASEQRAAQSFGSGGGFSWRSPTQTWQLEAVESYLANPMARLPSHKDFDRHGRATPELAALGEGYQVVANEQMHSLSGTSAAAPFFASLVSLLNEYRLQHGQSPLGFLNPLIYELAQQGKGFTDITIGGNRRSHLAFPIREGYSCTKGWDAVTGWGTPKFQDLLEYIKALPSGRRREDVII